MTSEQLKIYEILERNKVLSSRKPAILMGYKETAKVRQHIATLRQAFIDEKVDKLVCYKQNKGYFLSNDLEDARYLIERNDRQARTMMHNNSILKRRMRNKDNIQFSDYAIGFFENENLEQWEIEENRKAQEGDHLYESQNDK